MTISNISKKIILTIIPVLSLIIGFLIEEDLSTGGSSFDFIKTFPAVINLSNNIYDATHEYTRHFPLHYFLLSIPQSFFNNIFITKLIYFLFSLLFPIFIYLNTSKLYPDQKFNIYIISLSLLFLPFYRASAFWPNAHLTALIFLLIANYFYILNTSSKNFTNKFFNILFLTLSTYCMQSYAVFFIFYLILYFKNISSSTFLKILFFCAIFSLPGLYIVLNTPTGAKIGFTNNLSYTLITNFSIIFFCLLFFLSNKSTYHKVRDAFTHLNKYEVIIFLLFFFLLISTYENFASSGGGFFYKISNYFLGSNFLFYLTGSLGLVIFYLLFKIDRSIFYTLLIINFTAIGYATSQKYFEPILIALIFILNKNFFAKNIITKSTNTLFFYMLCMFYYIISLINNNYEISKNLIINY